jgi:hypothetical protein
MRRRKVSSARRYASALPSSAAAAPASADAKIEAAAIGVHAGLDLALLSVFDKYRAELIDKSRHVALQAFLR